MGHCIPWAVYNDALQSVLDQGSESRAPGQGDVKPRTGTPPLRSIGC